MQKEGKKVSVVIPAYNESAGIAWALRELTEQVDLSETEIIVVDDGSTDNTAEIAEGFPGVRLIRHQVNRGYGSAIKTGVRAAEGEIVAWYDADGQHRPEDLERVVDEMIEKKTDYCIGVRGKDSNEDHTRIFGKWLLKKFLQFFSDEPVADFNSGLRAFKRSVLLSYLSYLPKRFGASTVTTLLMKEGGYNGSEVPITVRKRLGKSSVKQIRDGMRTMLLILDMILLFRPMRIFGVLGVIISEIGLLYGIISAVQYGSGLSVLSSVLILFGFLMFCMGLLSRQISRIWQDRLDRYTYTDMKQHTEK